MRGRPDPIPDDLRTGHRNGNTAGPYGVLLAHVKAEVTAWLWYGRIPFGKITVVDGDPGNGKSAVATDAAARVSVGRPWPDGAPCEAGGVVMMNAEDGLADTIRPRLDAAGGDPDRVLALSTVPDGDSERMVSIPEDLDVLRHEIESVGAKLVVIDPLMAFLSGAVNSHNDQDVRRALAPLAKLAEETGAAIVIVRHLNKATGGNPLYRGGGSIGIVGQARSALLVAKDPEDDDRRVLAPLKSNLGKPAPSLGFSLVEAANGAVRVEWGGEVHHAAAALLSAPTDPEERSALDEAMDFLRDALEGGPVWNVEVKKDARAAGISEITLKRAKAGLGVRAEKQGDGSWSWALQPRKGNEGYQGAPPPKDDPVDHLDPLPANGPIAARQGNQDDQGDQGDRPGSDDPLPDDDILEI